MELTDDEMEFLHGKCHLFAIAMQDLTDLPLGAILEYDDDMRQTYLIHAFVLDGDDHGLDITGRNALDDIIDYFDCADPELFEMTREDLLLLGHGRRKISEKNLDLKKARVAAIKVWSKLRDESHQTLTAA